MFLLLTCKSPLYILQIHYQIYDFFPICRLFLHFLKRCLLKHKFLNLIMSSLFLFFLLLVHLMPYLRNQCKIQGHRNLCLFFSPQSCSLCNMVSLSKKGSYNMGTFWEQCSKCNFNFVLNLFCFIFLFDCFDWKKVKAYTALVMDHAMSIQESLKLKFSQEEKSQETRQKGHHWNGQRKCSL